mgnify:FL=1
MTPTNVLILCVDQQTTKVLGCYGNDIIKTPNIDRLANQGVRFDNAYTPSPLCVPARATMATGRHVHELNTWDGCHPYTGHTMSWGHHLVEAGHSAVSIGKLHYRNEADETGFSKQIMPMHVPEAGGDLISLVRSPLPSGRNKSKLFETLGPGGSAKTDYDTLVTQKACAWLQDQAPQENKPWCLFVSQVSPHPPLNAPVKFFELYEYADIAMPKMLDAPLHPWIQQLRNTLNDADFMDDEAILLALRNYYGLCSFTDYNIGLILKTLEDSDLMDTTRIIFVSDHGDNLGARTLWNKCNMYQEAAQIPMIVTGPGIPKGRVSKTGCSLLDIAPTVLDGVGIDPSCADFNSLSRSLFSLANKPDDLERIVFSEYHGMGSPSASYMIRRGHYKFIYYVGYSPELFDLDSDPEELKDLGMNPNYREIIEEYEAILCNICDPESEDRRAKDKQQMSLEVAGGRETVEKLGWLQGTPVPGEKADFWR